MTQLNFETAEKLIFQNPAMRRILPEFSHLIDQYGLGLKVPALKQLGKRSILEFLEKVEDHHLKKISGFLNQEISNVDFHFKTVENINTPLEKLCDSLCESNFFPNFTITRSENDVKILFWK